jgi:hypothetical protein
VDLDAVNLVSWMAIMAGGLGLFVSDWSPGNEVLSVPQFHVSIFVAGIVWGMFCGFMGGKICMGLCSLKSILFKNNPGNTIVERFLWGRLD